LDLLGYSQGHSKRKLLSASRVVKKKNGYWEWMTFQTQIEDLHLNCGILGGNIKKQGFRNE